MDSLEVVLTIVAFGAIVYMLMNMKRSFSDQIDTVRVTMTRNLNEAKEFLTDNITGINFQLSTTKRLVSSVQDELAQSKATIDNLRSELAALSDEMFALKTTLGVVGSDLRDLTETTEKDVSTIASALDSNGKDIQNLFELSTGLYKDVWAMKSSKVQAKKKKVARK